MSHVVSLCCGAPLEEHLPVAGPLADAGQICSACGNACAATGQELQGEPEYLHMETPVVPHPAVSSRNHNHVTRDIKPEGQCPGCDSYHASRRAAGEG